MYFMQAFICLQKVFPEAFSEEGSARKNHFASAPLRNKNKMSK